MALITETLSSETVMSDYDQLFCCCCLVNGCSKDISTEYNDTGKSEVYSDIIERTFSINIECEIQKPLSDTLWKQYVCEQCIVQLRNAYALKIKLMKNHEAFLLRLAKWQKAGFKDEKGRIKSECNHSDDNVYENKNNEIQAKECEDKSKLLSIKQESTAFDNNIMNKSVDHQLDVINTRKGSKHLKGKKKIDGVKKTLKRTSESKKSGAAGTMLRDNSLKLIRNSTLWVFQWKGHGEYICYLCRQPYTDVDALKRHTKTHTIKEIENKITNSSNGRVKVEISELFCKICNNKVDNLSELQMHLKSHRIDISDHLLVPFKLDHELKCQICQKIFQNFRVLKSHILKHYQRFVCEKCGAEFYKKEYLNNHIANKHAKFKTVSVKKFKCRFCHDKFSTYPRKLEHLIKEHGIKKPEFSCKMCSKVYIIKGLLNRHMKLTHLNELKEKNYECDVCFKRFYRSHDVTRHKETHTDGLNYVCDVCNHGFKLKTSLGRHVRRMHKS